MATDRDKYQAGLKNKTQVGVLSNDLEKIQLAEEREEKLRKRKELKKAIQKLKKDSKEQNLEKR